MSYAKVTRARRQDRRATAHRADCYARKPAALGTLLRQGTPHTKQRIKKIYFGKKEATYIFFLRLVFAHLLRNCTIVSILNYLNGM